MSDPSRLQLIAGLHALADFYETRPTAYYDGMRVTISMYAADRHALKALASMAAAFAEEEEKGAAGKASSGPGGSETPVESDRASAAAPAAGAGKCGKSCCATQVVLTRDFSAKVRLEIFVPGAAVCRRGVRSCLTAEVIGLLRR